MNYTCILFGVIFLISGILFAKGRLHEHISAWKDMSDKEKEYIKIRPLCRNIVSVISLSGTIFLLKGVINGFSDRWFVAAMILWLVISGIDIYFIEKKHIYEINN